MVPKSFCRMAAMEKLITFRRGPVAQLGRAPDWQSGGRGFDPLRVHQPEASEINRFAGLKTVDKAII